MTKNPAMKRHLDNGMPTFVYGTAWKEDDTPRLVRMALDAGFRGIDTANQRRHYHEVAVGQALAEAYADGVVSRDQIFIQTKFTHAGGQDHRLPYDPHADMTTQVEQSFSSSLEHLGVDHIDSYVLHGPSFRDHWAPEDLEVWRAMETLARDGKAGIIGVSNVSAAQLAELCTRAEVPPAVVQNRCFAELGWDREVRAVCREHGVVYQGFSLLTANGPVFHHSEFRRIVERKSRSPAQVVFRFGLQLGMVPLTGTSSADHARADLEAYDFELSDDEVDAIERLMG